MFLIKQNYVHQIGYNKINKIIKLDILNRLYHKINGKSFITNSKKHRHKINSNSNINNTNEKSSNNEITNTSNTIIPFDATNLFSNNNYSNNSTIWNKSINNHHHRYNKRKDHIPKRIRELVWTTYNGNIYNAKCFVIWCSNDINVFNFQVGHDIPESKGGTLDINNLKPICGNCNLSMGNQYTIQEWNKLINGNMKSNTYENTTETDIETGIKTETIIEKKENTNIFENINIKRVINNLHIKNKTSKAKIKLAVHFFNKLLKNEKNEKISKEISNQNIHIISLLLVVIKYLSKNKKL